MGFYYRKSVSIGPFRINVGKSGVGYSVGGKGFRTGVSGRGKRYSTFSVPETGLGYRTEHKGQGRCPKTGEASCDAHTRAFFNKGVWWMPPPGRGGGGGGHWADVKTKLALAFTPSRTMVGLSQ